MATEQHVIVGTAEQATCFLKHTDDGEPYWTPHLDEADRFSLDERENVAEAADRFLAGHLIVDAVHERVAESLLDGDA